MMKIYENVRRLREERGLSQAELAMLVGYKSRAAISHIENGNCFIPQSKIMKFAEVLDVLPGDLMGWDEPEQADQFSIDEKALINRYRMLNNVGRKAAIARLEELSFVPKYAKAEL